MCGEIHVGEGKEEEKREEKRTEAGGGSCSYFAGRYSVKESILDNDWYQER